MQNAERFKGNPLEISWAWGHGAMGGRQAGQLVLAVVSVGVVAPAWMSQMASRGGASVPCFRCRA